MNAPLVLLTKLQLRAAVRRAWRGARTLKGAAFAVVGAAVCVLWLAPMLFSIHHTPKSNPDTVRLFAPVGLLVLAVITLVATGSGRGDNRAISFTPGEVNFLFPGPFTQRQLLIYKLARTAAGAVLAGLMFSVVLLQHSTSWPAAFAAGVLAMLFVNLLTVAIILATQAAGARAYSLGRRIVLGIVLCAVVAGLAPSARTLYERGRTGGVLEAGRVLNESPVSRVVLAPLVPFGNAFTARSWPALLGWGATAAAIDALLLLLILRLDADYRDAALAASERAMQRVERARRGQIVSQQVSAGAAGLRTRIGMLPWLGGAGPTLWRQLVTAVRTSRTMLIVLTLMSCAVIVPMFFTTRSLTPLVIGAAGYATVLLTAMMKFDFRAEIDQLAWLKALPLRPTATAAGQLAVPTVFITILQWILLGAGAAFAKGDERTYLLAAIALLLPFNLLLLGVENLLFLMFPARSLGAAPGDVAAIGRQVVFFVLKLVVVGLTAGIIGSAAGLTYALTRPSPVPAIAVAFVLLSAIAVAMVPLVGRAYARFDPSRDTPA